jgi:hypothetical protein
MNASALFIYVGFPVVFLTVATANPRNLLMKAVCIALAYLSLILMDNCIFGGNALGTAVAGPSGIIDKGTSPFGLIFLGISLWGYVLISYGAGKTERKDSEQ